MDQAAKVRRQMNKENATIQKAKGELEVLKAEEDSMPGKTEQLKALVEEAEKELEAVRSAVATGKLQNKQAMDYWMHALALYKKWLGLEFVKIRSDTLKFTFTQIDSLNHDRPFSITLIITQDDKYTVDSCSPKVRLQFTPSSTFPFRCL